MSAADMHTLADALRWALRRIETAKLGEGYYFERADALLFAHDQAQARAHEDSDTSTDRARAMLSVWLMSLPEGDAIPKEDVSSLQVSLRAIHEGMACEGELGLVFARGLAQMSECALWNFHTMVSNVCPTVSQLRCVLGRALELLREVDDDAQQPAQGPGDGSGHSELQGALAMFEQLPAMRALPGVLLPGKKPDDDGAHSFDFAKGQAMILAGMQRAGLKVVGARAASGFAGALAWLLMPDVENVMLDRGVRAVADMAIEDVAASARGTPVRASEGAPA